MKLVREKNFGEIKRQNKAKRRAWELNSSINNISSIGGTVDKEILKNLTERDLLYFKRSHNRPYDSEDEFLKRRLEREKRIGRAKFEKDKKINNVQSLVNTFREENAKKAENRIITPLEKEKKIISPVKGINKIKKNVLKLIRLVK